eukprot:TRINITY_DN47363_c0_g1_i1.p1 TRINITY_DN47363_c0_g1~~TRINITY_DN47363_c0_g1_i1.p1  ORF type:complete len:210 (+),score=37.63 TRINITY_DN47363_c0_g1_i1:97-726(+)
MRSFKRDHPTALMYWYACGGALSMANYNAWIRYEEPMLGAAVRRSYQAFLVLYFVSFFTVSGACFYWAQMVLWNRSKGLSKAATRPEDRLALDGKAKSVARTRVHVGIAFLWFAGDTPLFILSLHVIYIHGWIEVVQGIDFVVKLLSWIMGMTVVWFMYLWRISKVLHRHTGPDRHIFRDPRAPVHPYGGPTGGVAFYRLRHAEGARNV